MRPETRHSFALVLGTGVSAVLSLAYAAHVASVLGPAQAADFFAAMFIVYLFGTATAPINGTVARFTSLFTARETYGQVVALSRQSIHRVGQFAMVVVAIGVVLLGPLTGWLNFGSTSPLVLAYAILSLGMLLSVIRGVLRGLHRFNAYGAGLAIEAGLRLGLAALFLMVRPTAASALLAYLVALMVILAVMRWGYGDFVRRHEPTPIDAGPVRRFAVPMFLLATVSAGYQIVDVFVVKHFFAPADAGAYGAAATLARTIALAVTPFSLVLVPLVAARHERGRRIRGTILRLFVYFLLLAAVPMTLFWRWPESIVRLLYGPDFSTAAGILLPAAGAHLLGAIAVLIGMTLASINRFRFLYVYTLVLVGEVLALLIWHDSLATVVSISLLGQSAALASMLASLALTGTRSGTPCPSGDSNDRAYALPRTVRRVIQPAHGESAP